MQSKDFYCASNKLEKIKCKSQCFECIGYGEKQKKTQLNQSAPIFWKGKLCKFIKWETLNFGGKLKIKIDKKFIEVDFSELTN